LGYAYLFTHVEWIYSHDLSGYILRTVEWAEELRAGHLYPRWAPDLYGGYGEPIFVFYAPTVYAVAGLLSATFLDPFSSLKLIILVSSLLSGVSVYWLIFGETRDRDAALLGAAAFLAAPYRLGDLYARGDVSELSCLAILPTAIALYFASAREARPFRARALAAAAAATHGLMIVTHTVLGLWGSLVVGLVVLARIIVLSRRGLWRRARPLILALACAPGLAGAYVVPALAYRDVSHAFGMVLGLYKPQNQWIGLNVLFDSQSALFGKNFMQIGPIVVVAAVVTALAAGLNFKRTRPALGWLALSLALIGLTLPNANAFWQPGRIPLSQFIQFPWRLLGPAALSASVALGIGMAAATTRLSEQTRQGIAISSAAALLLLIAWPIVSAKEMRKADILTDPDSIRAAVESATSADEFLPLAVKARPSTPRRGLVAGAENANVEFSLSDGSRHALAVVATKPGAVVQLALYGFPGWRVRTDSGPALATLNTDAEGLLFVRLPSSGKYQLEVWYGTPIAVPIGWLVTGLSVLVLCGMLLRGSSWWPIRFPVVGARSAT
jgi:hypothetical protein